MLAGRSAKTNTPRTQSNTLSNAFCWNPAFAQVKGSLRKERTKPAVSVADSADRTRNSRIPAIMPQRNRNSIDAAMMSGKRSSKIDFPASTAHSHSVGGIRKRKIQLAFSSTGMSNANRMPRMQQ